VVAEGFATLIDVPVPTSVPPQLPAYHFTLSPAPPAAVSVTLPVSPAQIALGVADADVGAAGRGFTFRVRLLEVAEPQEFVATQS
jgi:hypothetical protein